MPITQENLFSSMQDWLRKCDMKTLGYHNKIKAQKAQKCFCDSLHLLEFLDIFSYDLVYGSQEFFLAVAEQSQKDLGVNQCEFEAQGNIKENPQDKLAQGIISVTPSV